MNRLLIATSAIALSVTLPGPAHAGVVEFTDDVSFLAAVSNPTTYGFNGIAPSGSFTVNASVTGGGGAVFTPEGSGSQFVMAANSGYGAYGASFVSEQSGSPNGAVVTLGTPATAIGFDIGSYDNASDSVSILLSTGDSFSLSLPASENTKEFIGFTSSTPITSFTITESGNVIDVIDYTLATAAVPEPASLGLLGLGLAGLRLVRRKRA